MKLALSSSFTLLYILVGFHTAHAVGPSPLSRRNAQSRDLQPRRTSSLLINPAAFPDLPTLRQADRTSAAAGLNLDDIQGDILVGMQKKKELFFFFRIEDVAAFKTHLAQDIHPRITSTRELLSVALQPVTALNIAFSHSGLSTLKVDLGEDGVIGDATFAKGQAATIDEIGDASTVNWVEAFKETDVHGVLLLASDTIDNIDTELKSLLSILGSSITEKYRLQGSARPGDQEGHEHFGYMDGISQPAVEGFVTAPHPGQEPIQPGVILAGEEGDFGSRPAWTKDGSFLVFRQMKQRVPEFEKFIHDNALTVEGLSDEENAQLLGARMVGRWKSGAPIDLSPRHDNVTLANDPQLNNNFNFTHPDSDFRSDITRCPFSAHIRKTKPRADLPGNINHIIRAGIPYGPEVTDAEKAAQASDDSLERGLAFVAYQSALQVGFVFLQKNWINNAGFIFNKNDSSPGVDPIIGVIPQQVDFDVDRPISGLDPDNAGRDITIQSDFIVSRGGEYFFSPSISSILDTLSV